MKSFKHYLIEGGNAVSGVGRINQDNVAATLKDLFSVLLPKLKVSPKDVISVGSTGKKRSGDSSGDIDLAIDVKSLMRGSGKNNMPDIYNFLDTVASTLTASNIKDSRGLGEVSFAFPITNADGKQPNATVQVDMFISDSLEYSGWIYYGPNYNESELKGVHRTLLLSFVAKYAEYVNVKSVGPEVAVRKRLLIDMSKGLISAVQSREGKTGLLKNFKTIERQLVSHNPDEIVHTLFGPEYSAKDMLSFESIYKVVSSPGFINAKHRDDILRDTREGLISLGYPVPLVISK